ncbi:MAG: tRNA preQ1(34) S-adenosylmethionine ribosyltransferase-isomerase QueA [Acidimicrobiales bacterium]
MDAYDYGLPEAAIAQEPAEPRSAARLLVATDPGGGVVHARVADLASLLGPGDLVVVNDSKVLPARLGLRKATGGAVEVLLLEQMSPTEPSWWQALLSRSRRVSPGDTLYAGDQAAVEVGEVLPGGRRMVKLLDPALPEAHGVLPLPPYLHQPLADPSRYQTVYARRPGSVAAPTAGLHLDRPLLDALAGAGVALATVELSVGLDTFRPVTAERPEDHVIHTEAYVVPPETMEACARARRVVAVGTTTVRALETVAATGEGSGRTSLYIHGEYDFRVVDVLLTNFHLPRSSLLLMVESFAGPRWRELYRVALAEGYRFLSLGDAMLVGRGGS